MQTASPASFAPERAIVVKGYRPAPMWNQAVYVAWFFTLFLPLPEFSLIRFACLGVILGLFAINRDKTVPLLLKAWPLLLFPIMGVLSVGWSTYPRQAIIDSVLLLLTPPILVTFAALMQPKEFFRVMMLAGIAVVAYFGLGFGIFTGDNAVMHKQLLAYHLLIISISGLASALNKQEALIFRIIGLAVFGSAFAMQVQAESATSLVLGIIAITLLVGARYIWVPMSRITHLRSLVFIIIMTIALSGLIAFLSLPQNTVVKDFMDLVGKDSTLTGRTIIWEAASHVVRDKPIFGHGLGGFWNPNVGVAQTLAELTHSKPGTNISFHSVYWEARVHLGWVGLGILYFALIWAAWRNIRQWLKETSLMNTGMLVMLIISAATIATESYLSGPFNTIVTSFYFGALASFDAGGQKFILRPTWKPVKT